MHCKIIATFAGAVLFVAAIPPLAAQVAPAGTTGGIPLKVGVGLSDYDVDYGHGRMLGGAIWVDYTPNRIPRMLYGLGIEAEARDISINPSPTQPPNYRLDTVGGGPIYTIHLRKLRSLEPYGKFLLDYGGIDWNNPDPQYKHETRTVPAPGMGFEYRVYHDFLVRVDYEYQFWPDFAIMSPGGHVLNPQGFTVGATYDFGGFHRNN